MYFHILCVDKPNHGEVRKANREKHLAYLDRIEDRVVIAGPILSDDGQAMLGSVLVIDFPDRAAAEAWCRDDPYNQADLFDSVTIKPWRQVYPKAR